MPLLCRNKSVSRVRTSLGYFPGYFPLLHMLMREVSVSVYVDKESRLQELCSC